MRAWIFLFGAILADVVATSCLKVASGSLRPWPIVGAVTGYIVAYSLMSLALKSVPLAIAYAIWSAVGITLITLIGSVIFNQRLSVGSSLGIALIVLGVGVLGVTTPTSLPLDQVTNANPEVDAK